MSEKAHVERLLEKERLLNRIEPSPVKQVGEMRDAETAPSGLEASLTGHLVLSTLHTNSAPETITRLIDMGMNPLNFSDALLAILAQRLVRTICPDCKEPYHPNQGEFDVLVDEYDRELFSELSRAFYARPNELAEAASR